MVQLFDQGSYFHFATGIIMYSWNLSLGAWLIIYVIWQILDYIFQPKSLQFPQTGSNTIHLCWDTVATILGWYSARFLHELQFSGKRMHIAPTETTRLTMFKYALLWIFIWLGSYIFVPKPSH